MKNLFIPYELSLKMKNLGFNEPCFGYYNNNNEFTFFADIKTCNTNSEFGFHPTAPIFSQAVGWFREKYHLHSTITSISQESWQWHIAKPGEILGALYDEDFYTYEEAEFACLNELIKIVGV